MQEHQEELDRLTRAVKAIVDGEIDHAIPDSNGPLNSLVKQIKNMQDRLLRVTKTMEEGNLDAGQTQRDRLNSLRALADRFDSSVASAMVRVEDEVGQALDNSHGTLQQIDQVATATRESSEAVNDIDRMMQSSSQVAGQVSERADLSREATRELGETAKGILSIAQVIESIANRTNLLALNASIEAARVGAAGRGFAVVAGEVKELAQQTREATDQVKSEVERVTKSVDRAISAADEIASASNVLMENNQAIAAALVQQNTTNAGIAEYASDAASSMQAIDALMTGIRQSMENLQLHKSEFISQVRAEPGVRSDGIIFGQTAPFSGPAASAGLAMKEGIELAFAQVNSGGGVHGRQLILEASDDAYDPDRALQNVRTLLREDNAFAFLGPIGTPTSRQTESVARGARIPFIGPVTGAAFLRDKTLDHVLNVRPSYGQELEALMSYAEKSVSLDRVALFFQADAYGQAVMGGLRDALKRRGKQIFAQGSYDREKMDIEGAFQALKEAEPSVIVMAATAPAAAAFLKLAKAEGLKSMMMTISFVGSTALTNGAGSAAEGVVISQVVPVPFDESIPLVRSYREAARHFRICEKPDFLSLEGYIAGMFAAEVLQQAGRDVTRDSFLALTTGQGYGLDFGGFTLEFGPGRNQGTDKIFLTRIEQDGRFAAIDAPAAGQMRAAAGF